jgi:hypothetical protein
MRMVPTSPAASCSNAERKVFYALKNAGCLEGSTCLHSLGLPRHAYKACCELDFVIVGPDGLFALEVKGGGVSRNEKGQWVLTDRRGEQHIHKEGPFKQVQGNFYALLDQLKKHVSGDLVAGLPKGWGVVFPDCAFNVTSVEWDDATIADQRRMGQFSIWLQNLVRYYRHKQGKDASCQVPAGLVQTILDLLRPRFELVPSLGGAVGSAEMALNCLTEDQCHAVDILTANPRVICRGGAGTGKTFLAMELARRGLAEELRVALCCSSPWLRHYLDARLQHPELKVLTIDKARRAANQTSPVDLLITDEGQDLMNFDDLDVLDKLVEGGLAKGNWCVFCDSNNQVGLVGQWDSKAFEFLSSMGVTQVPLKRNCRNTRPIVEEVERHTGCDMGSQEQGGGPRVELLRLDAGADGATALTQTLRSLQSEGVSPSQITVLSPKPWEESCASRLPGREGRDIVQLDEFNLRAFPPKHVSYARIQDFKGLENTVIILVDLEDSHLDRSAPALLYVGMSRARAYLRLQIG